MLDAYVRGNDLVASYEVADRGDVQPHVYFRASRLQDAAGLELIVSMQTGLLDSQPESIVTSELNASEVLVLDSVMDRVPEPLATGGGTIEYLGSAGRAAYLFVFRLDDSLSYAEMVHPGDFVSVSLTSTKSADGGTRHKLAWRLFPERLEKGVIRRSRMAGWFLPRENDQQVAADVFSAFVHEPLPLTA